MTEGHAGAASPFRQPKAVWAVAFACVVSFMGIGLVDPILPALAKDLKASPSSVELLFTSYLVITAVAMLVTGWVSSRIGAKHTLVAGLVLIVVFSALAGSSNSINGIVEMRAGWGIGNALFIATSLAVIVASASGGFAGAIVLYETALGVGIGLGPLVGGELGGISWRGPFFGVTVLMSISLIATLVLVDRTPRPTKRTSITEPITALRHRGLAIMSVTALCYNWGFFTLLAYTPFPMHLGVHQLGYTFTGWGVLVAIFAVFVAPRLQRRFGTPRTLYVNLALLAADLVVIAAFTTSQATLIVAVIVSGAFVGLNNTLTTQAVMLVAPVERPIASASYGFVRFIGGGLAPYVAAKLAAHFNVHVPFYLGAAAVVLGIVVLTRGHSLIAAAERAESEEQLVTTAPPAVAAGTAPAVTPSLAMLAPSPDGRRSPIVVAVDDRPGSDQLCATAADLAEALACPIEILHMVETDLTMEQAIETEDTTQAATTLKTLVDQVAARGVPATGHLLEVVGDHGDVGRRIAAFADQQHARMIIAGAPTHGPFAGLLDASTTAQLARHTHCDLHIVHSTPPT
ncbi:MFS transporter [Acidiferrimicrobium sp. IK]|uniref:MFS transporter n=1 Tax=Acidiferrimicrobium sp. IK TaxID=2871700 RepID=UPI0021CB7BD3|nr:MFS transporter [Acidiferrimicrobium sp. IK]MCU4187485.1 MFS transporter [Acidiferrimicrobium sp. IK]